jgi:hypothetical protein
VNRFLSTQITTRYPLQQVVWESIECSHPPIRVDHLRGLHETTWRPENCQACRCKYSRSPFVDTFRIILELKVNGLEAADVQLVLHNSRRPHGNASRSMIRTPVNNISQAEPSSPSEHRHSKFRPASSIYSQPSPNPITTRFPGIASATPSNSYVEEEVSPPSSPEFDGSVKQRYVDSFADIP